MAVIDSAVLLLRANTYSGSGNWLDGSGNGHNAVPTGSPTFDGTKFSLNGSSQYFTVSDHANLDFAAGDSFTLMVWAMRPTGATGTDALLNKKNDTVSPGAAGYGLYSYDPANIVGLFSDGTIGEVKQATVTGSTPYVVAYRRSVAGDAQSIFINGTEDGAPDPDGTTATLANSNSLRIGATANATPASFWQGDIYAVAIWRSALSDADIATATTELTASPITGTGASTLAGVTSAGTGAEGFPATGTSTLPGVTSAGTGTVNNPITGTGSSTLAGVTSAGVGTEGFPGTGASTLAGVTSAGAGVEGFGATGASTLDGVTSVGAGTVTNPISGTGASTLDGVTSAGVGAESMLATGTSTLGDVTSVGAGDVTIDAITGTGSSTLDDATSSGSGELGIPGTGTSTLEDVTSTGSGLVANPVTGTGTSTLAGVTSQGVGNNVSSGHAENVTCDLLGPLGACDSIGPLCVGTLTT